MTARAEVVKILVEKAGTAPTGPHRRPAGRRMKSPEREAAG
ncbi:hypothetical protein ACWT_2387 [Actinoplanes sp. SE50]|nr:hypothetical protein ACPL_2514 [Actinoplanes sp. SE50/110]ATO81802.1 hypothetical protein ACWT_2387 [Actinoplanes sp. SE50]SLL99210.1 hypothetical protein ACSP50_2441 [Actinoplanes sp. SE50/110]